MKGWECSWRYLIVKSSWRNDDNISVYIWAVKRLAKHFLLLPQGGRKGKNRPLLASTLNGVKWSASRYCPSDPGETAPSPQMIGGSAL
jgi:hypothetical protein